jgi:hypothetical protein
MWCNTQAHDAGMKWRELRLVHACAWQLCTRVRHVKVPGAPCRTSRSFPKTTIVAEQMANTPTKNTR